MTIISNLQHKQSNRFQLMHVICQIPKNLELLLVVVLIQSKSSSTNFCIAASHMLAFMYFYSFFTFFDRPFHFDHQQNKHFFFRLR